ncbi:MAG: LytTR family DNA-binding domain-containing protein [Flavobacteriales bacterium]|nr:LytTR family DNA-binding domain-containing protein [Flavobacteriales bacterium]
MKKAVIIDDVENARISLRSDLEDYCEQIEVIGEADGVVSGARLLKEMKPDIVFLDIQMRDGSGFDLLEILPEIDFALIFTTSSDEHAIQAFRFSAIDYLLKPIDPEQLMEAVGKAEKMPSKRLEVLRSNLGGTQRLALNSQDKIRIVELEEVVRCESHGSYTMFYTRDGESILVTKTLKEYDLLLSDLGFLRVHQSHLVNMKYIKEFNKSDGGQIVLKDRTDIPVSSRKKTVVMRALSHFA